MKAEIGRAISRSAQCLTKKQKEMFLDDQIVEIAESRDWKHWSTRELVTYDVMKILHKRFVDAGHKAMNDSELLMEVKRIKNALSLASARLEKKNIHLKIEWNEVIDAIFHANEDLVKKLQSV